MKTKLLIIAVVSILVSACTTGTYTTRTYDDDIYFSPADLPPVVLDQNSAPVSENSTRVINSNAGNERIVMSQKEKNTDGTVTMNNYILEPDQANKNSKYQAYKMNQQDLIDSDTTLYYNDDSVKYVINNYYDDNDIDFSYRINRFHRPYYYSPFFYDDWNYGYYSPYSYHYGWGGWGYDSWNYGGWGYPYNGFYSPFSFGFGGYYNGYYGNYYGGYYGYGGYNNSYYDGYYNGYNNGYYGSGGGFYNDRKNHDNVRYGRSSDFSNYADGNNQRNNVIKNSSISRNVDGGLPSNSSNSRLPNDNNIRTQVARPATGTTGNVRRSYEPSTTGRTYNQSSDGRQSQNYTPSYSKPRIVNQSNYNNNTYARPRTSDGNYQQPASVKSANTGSQSYSEPRSTATMRQTYRSSTSYSNGSSNSSNRNSNSGYGNTNSSSPSYNISSSPSPSYTPSERSSGSSSSGGSYNSGSSSSGSSSGGSSGGSSSGGSGGREGSGGRR